MSLYSLAPGIQEIILTGEGVDRLRSVRDIRQVVLPEEWGLQEGVVFRALGSDGILGILYGASGQLG